MRRPTLKLAPNGELYESESAIQRASVRLFRTLYPEFALLFFSIPNGAKMGGKKSRSGHAIQASIMIGEGMTSGVADTLLSMPGSGLHGLYVEFKTPVGTWAKEQREFFRKVTPMKYGYAIARNLSQFERLVNDYLTGNYEQELNEAKLNKGYKTSA